jgi:hypothetical protein
MLEDGLSRSFATLRMTTPPRLHPHRNFPVAQYPQPNTPITPWFYLPTFLTARLEDFPNIASLSGVLEY